MNDKLQYATMLEIPVNTVSVTFKPQKKRRKAKKINHDQVKKEVVEKVNAKMEEQEETAVSLFDQQEEQNETTEIFTEPVNEQVTEKKKFKVSVIGVQLVIIGLLVATIFLTNAVYTDSGINVFLRGVFGNQNTTQVDARTYDEFAPVIALDDGANMQLEEGVITLSGKGSVYASCDGKVTQVTKGEDGKYTIEITHSENFKSVLGGLDFAYAGLNDSVYHNIPVGYCSAQATMCFTTSDGSVISDYQIIDNSVVWAV